MEWEWFGYNPWAVVQGHPEGGHLEEEVSGGKLEQLTTVPMEVLEALWERYP